VKNVLRTGEDTIHSPVGIKAADSQGLANFVSARQPTGDFNSTGDNLPYPFFPAEYTPGAIKDEPQKTGLIAALIITVVMFVLLAMRGCGAGMQEAQAAEVSWQSFTNDQIADAIYKAEGGEKTRHPYGILAHYKHTSPRAACINTIRHARRDWNEKGDFISFLGSRYCPVGAANDPRGLNRNWIGNVKHFLVEVSR